MTHDASADLVPLLDALAEGRALTADEAALVVECLLRQLRGREENKK